MIKVLFWQSVGEIIPLLIFFLLAAYVTRRKK